MVLDDFALFGPPAPTRGRDSNAILEEIMDVPERSDMFKAKLNRIAELIDRGALDAARPAVDELAAQWGEDDREIVRLRTAMDFRGARDVGRVSIGPKLELQG